MLTNSAPDPKLRLEAIYDLARAYLADGLYGETLSTLDQLDQDLAAAGADADQFGQKEQFLRAEALTGLGQYAEAVAAYGDFSRLIRGWARLCSRALPRPTRPRTI